MVQDCVNVAEVRPSSSCRRRHGEHWYFAMFAVSEKFGDTANNGISPCSPFRKSLATRRTVVFRHVRRFGIVWRHGEQWHFAMFAISEKFGETANNVISPCSPFRNSCAKWQTQQFLHVRHVRRSGYQYENAKKQQEIVKLVYFESSTSQSMQ